MKKTKFKRLDQNELHEQFIKCFGTIEHSGAALCFSKQSVYNWIHDGTRPSRHKLAAGFKSHRKNVDELEAMLSDD